MKWNELMGHPNGVIFCEDDYPALPLFVKRETLDDDILIEAIFHKDDDGPYRIGWREMDDCERNSLDYHVLTEAERDRAVLKLIGPYALAS